MKKLLIGAAALLLLSACGQEPATEAVPEEAAELTSGIDVQYMDTSIKPGDDFFRYMNGTWLDETEIPADKSNYGGFVILADDAQEDVKNIIEKSATGDFAKGTDEQKVGDLYRSYVDMETRNARGVTPLQPELKRIDAIADADDLAVYFAAATKRGYGMPFVLAQFADMKNPKYYGIYAFQAGIGLPEREYYFKDDEKSVEIREKYVAHIEKMFDLAGLDNGAAAAETIMALETRIAEQHMKKEDARDWAVNYNKVPLDKLDGVMPNFNWQAYLAELELEQLDGLIVIMTDYMQALDGIIGDTDIDTWKTYLTWDAQYRSGAPG